MEEEQDEINDSPIEQVRLTVPTTDDPTLPVLTFRTWVLGLIACSLLSFVNQYFHYRQNRIFVSDLVAQILLLPVGKLMARMMPTNSIRVPRTKWTFSLNPGPFNIKEHALTAILASAGASSPYAVEIVSQSKVFYHMKIDPWAALLLIQTTQKEFKFDQKAYDNYSRINFSTFYALNYGFSFACITATLTHAALFYGSSIWSQLKEAHGDQKLTSDIHNQLMKKYDPIPQWWFQVILVGSVGIAIFACERFGGQLQLPFWGILLACALVLIFVVPIGVIQATSNQHLGLSIITELVMGYLYPGKPIANMAFKSYGMVSLSHALSFLYVLKQGHYMKIPPRSMFSVQRKSTTLPSSK